MNDELEQLRREVERLTAERDDYKSRYTGVLRALPEGEWEGVTQADLDAALASGDTISGIIAALDSGELPRG
jgi:hypothetical protein